MVEYWVCTCGHGVMCNRRPPHRARPAVRLGIRYHSLCGRPWQRVLPCVTHIFWPGSRRSRHVLGDNGGNMLPTEKTLEGRFVDWCLDRVELCWACVAGCFSSAA